MSSLQLKRNIEKAEQAVFEKRQSVKQGRMRQQYHFMAESGWINDPNGLIYFRGQYHLFYQFNPFKPAWGEMHWGHAVSSNLVDWTYLPVALAPSEKYDSHDQGGCFSGTSIEYEDKLYLFYTGTSREEGGFVQVQCLAESTDGVTFEKYEGNPVLRAPEGYEECDFRDPKVWNHDGSFYLICGTKKDGYARLLLYQSSDLKNWEYRSVMAESRGEWGEMWECPDFYSLSGTDVLTFSPVGAGERKTVYMTGKLDYQTGKFCCVREGEIDWGFDYYAPQTMAAGDGRRIMFGWAGGWDWMPWWNGHGPSEEEEWCGFFGIPREVRLLEDHSLQFIPVRELECLRRDKLLCASEVLITEGTPFSLPDIRIYEMKVSVDLKDTSAKDCTLRLCGDNDYYTDIVIDLKNQELRVDRNHADGFSCGVSRSSLYMHDNKNLDVHIFVDQSSVEVFANEYRNVHTCRLYPDVRQCRNMIMAGCGAVLIKNMELWPLISPEA